MAVERRRDQRQVISIRASPEAGVSERSLPLDHTGRGVTALCAGGRLGEGAARARVAHQTSAGRSPDPPRGWDQRDATRMLSGKHETRQTGGRRAGNQRRNAGLLERVNSRNHQPATLTRENGTALSGPNSWPDAQA